MAPGEEAKADRVKQAKHGAASQAEIEVAVNIRHQTKTAEGRVRASSIKPARVSVVVTQTNQTI